MTFRESHIQRGVSALPEPFDGFGYLGLLTKEAGVRRSTRQNVKTVKRGEACEAGPSGGGSTNSWPSWVFIENNASNRARPASELNGKSTHLTPASWACRCCLSVRPGCPSCLGWVRVRCTSVGIFPVRPVLQGRLLGWPRGLRRRACPGYRNRLPLGFRTLGPRWKRGPTLLRTKKSIIRFKNLICDLPLMIWSSPHSDCATSGSKNVTKLNALKGLGIKTSVTSPNFPKYSLKSSAVKSSVHLPINTLHGTCWMSPS